MRLAWPATASSIALSSDFGDEMVQRALVGAADIHAGAAADRLEPFEDLDVLGGIGGGVLAGGVIVEEIGHGATIRRENTRDKQDAGWCRQLSHNIL